MSTLDQAEQADFPNGKWNEEVQTQKRRMEVAPRAKKQKNFQLIGPGITAKALDKNELKRGLPKKLGYLKNWKGRHHNQYIFIFLARATGGTSL